jgi:glycosyltransferase involved in cell wall biosynthesis
VTHSAARRLAIIVSHPIQYYVPLYRRLAQRNDLKIKVFFTWHGGRQAVEDQGFKAKFQWDIPLVDGYDSDVVPNTSRTPGTHHFFGLQNPTLVQRVLDWKPDAVHITGYAWHSHLLAIRKIAKRAIPVLFRGDSHLLDTPQRGFRWLTKRLALRRIFSWPAAFLYVGQANRAYYEAMGVPASRLVFCPHSIETDRFASPAEELESRAGAWRRELDISDDRIVLLFAGKFETKKRPLELMRAVQRVTDSRLVLVMAGDGEYSQQVKQVAATDLDRFRVIPFQNQSQMPVVYRLGDLTILPSAYGETWGLAVNEAFACARPALVSDRVGCSLDMIEPGLSGDIFHADNWDDFTEKLTLLTISREHLKLLGQRSQELSLKSGIAETEASIVRTLEQLVPSPPRATCR